MEMKKMNLIGYVRISSESQEDNTSIETQVEGIENYCKAKGWNLVQIFVDVCSGKDFNRPEFTKMMEMINKDEINGVMVFKYDRLSRSPVDGRNFTDELEKKDIAFLSVQDNIDTSTPMGKAMFTMMLTFAEMERSIITERMQNGKRQRIKEGKKCNGFVYGYRWEGKGSGKRLVPVDEEAAVVKDIFKMAIRVGCHQTVADLLNDKRLKTRRGNQWTRFAVRKILKNKTYMGTLKYGENEYRGDHKPLISRYIFNKINSK
jgi:site-specific DNA recombinase